MLAEFGGADPGNTVHLRGGDQGSGKPFGVREDLSRCAQQISVKVLSAK
jgi:hypothetical protein